MSSASVVFSLPAASSTTTTTTASASAAEACRVEVRLLGIAGVGINNSSGESTSSVQLRLESGPTRGRALPVGTLLADEPALAAISILNPSTRSTPAVRNLFPHHRPYSIADDSVPTAEERPLPMLVADLYESQRYAGLADLPFSPCWVLLDQLIQTAVLKTNASPSPSPSVNLARRLGLTRLHDPVGADVSVVRMPRSLSDVDRRWCGALMRLHYTHAARLAPAQLSIAQLMHAHQLLGTLMVSLQTPYADITFGYALSPVVAAARHSCNESARLCCSTTGRLQLISCRPLYIGDEVTINRAHGSWSPSVCLRATLHPVRLPLATNTDEVDDAAARTDIGDIVYSCPCKPCLAMMRNSVSTTAQWVLSDGANIKNAADATSATSATPVPAAIMPVGPNGEAATGIHVRLACWRAHQMQTRASDKYAQRIEARALEIISIMPRRDGAIIQDALQQINANRLRLPTFSVGAAVHFIAAVDMLLDDMVFGSLVAGSNEAAPWTAALCRCYLQAAARPPQTGDEREMAAAEVPPRHLPLIVMLATDPNLGVAADIRRMMLASGLGTVVSRLLGIDIFGFTPAEARELLDRRTWAAQTRVLTLATTCVMIHHMANDMNRLLAAAANDTLVSSMDNRRALLSDRLAKFLESPASLLSDLPTMAAANVDMTQAVQHLLAHFVSTTIHQDLGQPWRHTWSTPGGAPPPPPMPTPATPLPTRPTATRANRATLEAAQGGVGHGSRKRTAARERAALVVQQKQWQAAMKDYEEATVAYRLAHIESIRQHTDVASFAEIDQASHKLVTANGHTAARIQDMTRAELAFQLALFTSDWMESPATAAATTTTTTPL